MFSCGVKKLIEKVVSIILSWLRMVLDLFSSSSVGDAINQPFPAHFSVFYGNVRELGLFRLEKSVSVKLKRKLHLKGA